ncbi:MAG: flavodoxin domain-containing protein [Chitinispirillia bacterium]|nr:flavodoxin domain-containing protein [Chitinispirillia bacterium]
MNKILVMYYSKNGTTKKYAQWIAEELKGDLYHINDIKPDMLLGYDVLILGSPILAGAIKGLSIFTKNYSLIKDKKLVFCACGIEDMSNEAVTDRISGYVEKAVPNELFKHLKLFFLRGGFDHYKLNFMYRLFFWIAKRKIDKKPVEKLTTDEKLVIETYGKNLDFTNKENIKPVVDYCN